MIDRRPRIINVMRKPQKCPVCGSSVVDIIYGTGDMTEVEFLQAYRKQGMMGGDNIPRRPPIWECSCGCNRFRKVSLYGADVPVKVKMLKNIRKVPATVINWTSELASQAMEEGRIELMNKYKVEVTTEHGETELLSITAVNGDDAENLARRLVQEMKVGLKGWRCKAVEVYDDRD